MPHVIVTLWPGKSEQQKKRLAEAITKDVMEILHYEAHSPVTKVYKPDMKDKWGTLYKEPGYDEKDL